MSLGICRYHIVRACQIDLPFFNPRQGSWKWSILTAIGSMRNLREIRDLPVRLACLCSSGKRGPPARQPNLRKYYHQEAGIQDRSANSELQGQPFETGFHADKKPVI
ncbi:hypothetical protein [Roseibium marinum]|uniref:hypothetical protein n=1 Tax=Roseibium marinum TaxID=281252 RepID=UPI0011AEE93E|nr:hypothetical protein [Roseibium marinum]